MAESWMTERLPQLRQLAVAQVIDEGRPTTEIAGILGVSVRTIERWRRAWDSQGIDGLRARPRPGRPPKLTEAQAAQVLDWTTQPASTLGLATERWTAPRVAALIWRSFGVRMNHRYLNAWLSARRVTPQIPDRVARERDDALIDRWVAHEWPRLKKTCRRPAQTSFSPMKADF